MIDAGLVLVGKLSRPGVETDIGWVASLLA